jgi:hypothetical protein
VTVSSHNQSEDHELYLRHHLGAAERLSHPDTGVGISGYNDDTIESLMERTHAVIRSGLG